jgi:hypothetical protein
MKPQSKRWDSYPPLCGIVQLTNSVALRFRNWSFTNRPRSRAQNNYAGFYQSCLTSKFNFVICTYLLL